MDKEKLKEMGQNPDFIKGIYNYCDRWCERCSFTSRCMLYATEREDADDPETMDIDNDKFWKQIEQSFQLAMELLYDFAKEEGIDLDNLATESVELEEKEIRKKAEEHPAAQQALQYSKQVREWFTSAEDDFEEAGETMLKKLTLGLPEEEIKKESEALRNLVEIVRWYQHQIYVKIMRALQGKYDHFDDVDPVQNDANGSAKVALIGIDRSLAAWGGLLEHFPDQEDDLFPILVSLQRIKQSVEQHFPSAGAFKRPGFDMEHG